jgi:uncharacterized protein YcbK (DUF882 family)
MFNNVSQAAFETFDLGVHGPYYRLSDNFRLWEWACNDGSPFVRVNIEMIDAVQTLRDAVGKLKVNSAYRTTQHNASIGGATNSRHLWGMATDLVPFQISVEELWEMAVELDFGGIGKYNAFIHVDNWRQNRRWYNTNVNQPR